jgi:hypothetical protein
MARDVADAVDVGDGGSAEFHYKTGHELSSGVPGSKGGYSIAA